MPRLLAPLVLCAIAHAALAAPGGTVHDAERGFSFTPPDGYADYPEGRAPGIAYSYARNTPNDPSFAVIRIQPMGGTIGRGPLVRETVERAARDSVRGTGVELTGFAYRKVKWKDFDLDLLVTHLANGDKKLVTLGTQAPLAKEAIQIYLLGPAGEEARLSSDLQGMLASLDGKSNWLSDDERDERLGRVVGMGVGAALAVGFALWWRRRRARS